jgi:hypothetical protein
MPCFEKLEDAGACAAVPGHRWSTACMRLQQQVAAGWFWWRQHGSRVAAGVDLGGGSVAAVSLCAGGRLLLGE